MGGGWAPQLLVNNRQTRNWKVPLSTKLTQGHPMGQVGKCQWAIPSFPCLGEPFSHALWDSSMTWESARGPSQVCPGQWESAIGPSHWNLELVYEDHEHMVCCYCLVCTSFTIAIGVVTLHPTQLGLMGDDVW